MHILYVIMHSRDGVTHYSYGEGEPTRAREMAIEDGFEVRVAMLCGFGGQKWLSAPSLFSSSSSLPRPRNLGRVPLLLVESSLPHPPGLALLGSGETA